jgi:hypothetical protein
MICGRLREERQRRVEVEGVLKDLVVIFIFLGVLCNVCFSFNATVLFDRKKKTT